MRQQQTPQTPPVSPVVDEGEDDSGPLPAVEDIQLPPEEGEDARKAGEEFVKHLVMGGGADPALAPANETLMPSGAVQVATERVALPVEIPEELAEATVVKTLVEERTRYDFSLSVTRLELAVEKKVLVTGDGERQVIAASTRPYGPAGWSVTWDGMATLAVLVSQFALPFNRLGTLFSSSGKRFTSAVLSRMFHAVAMRLAPIYLELGRTLANCKVLAGDDTHGRVLEVSGHFERLKAAAAQRKTGKETVEVPSPPWLAYRTREAASASLEKCRQTREDRLKRRRDGDRTARPMPAEIPTLGMLIGAAFNFESHLRNGEGPKSSLNISVTSGRSDMDDPRSLIVFYRSHLGSYGNGLEDFLDYRDPKRRHVVTQGDLSTTNLVARADLLHKFNIRAIGCSAHARRPFANYEHEDPDLCAYMLHLFAGLAMIEERLDVVGRNKVNVLAVRRNDGREFWEEILALAKDIAEVWAPATKLGTAARYIITHYSKLTAYLDDPYLEPSNNLRERMLRLEKLIEGASMFRKSLEGRFALDVVRTLVQTVVAAGVPVHEYLVWALSAERADVAASPKDFTPHAWAKNRSAAAQQPKPAS
ncbi:MAG: transposase [Chloroflexi bacterium]|nr:transposase [Chloroflexota bacterium]